jgi:hypothetical protein
MIEEKRLGRARTLPTLTSLQMGSARTVSNSLVLPLEPLKLMNIVKDPLVLLRILIVEDSLPIMKVVCQMLKQKGDLSFIISSCLFLSESESIFLLWCPLDVVKSSGLIIIMPPYPIPPSTQIKMSCCICHYFTFFSFTLLSIVGHEVESAPNGSLGLDRMIQCAYCTALRYTSWLLFYKNMSLPSSFRHSISIICYFGSRSFI